jgi:hypothetical protein
LNDYQSSGTPRWDESDKDRPAKIDLHPFVNIPAVVLAALLRLKATRLASRIKKHGLIKPT